MKSTNFFQLPNRLAFKELACFEPVEPFSTNLSLNMLWGAQVRRYRKMILTWQSITYSHFTDLPVRRVYLLEIHPVTQPDNLTFHPSTFGRSMSYIELSQSDESIQSTLLAVNQLGGSLFE